MPNIPPIPPGLSSVQWCDSHIARKIANYPPSAGGIELSHLRDTALRIAKNIDQITSGHGVSRADIYRSRKRNQKARPAANGSQVSNSREWKTNTCGCGGSPPNFDMAR